MAFKRYQGHWLKGPHVGAQNILVTSEIAEDLTYYFATSEQTPSSVALGVLMNKDNTVRQGRRIYFTAASGGFRGSDFHSGEPLKRDHLHYFPVRRGQYPEMILEHILGRFRPGDPR